MSDQRLKAGQVWIKGDESFVVLWSDGTSGIRAVEQTLVGELWPTVKLVLDFIQVDDLIREGWSLGGKHHEHHDGAVCVCGNPSGVILESKPPKCADCRREVSDE